MADKQPNFIVIGAMKAATTSLYTYLKQHPDIFMTKIKEPMFFNNYKQHHDYKMIGKKSIKNTDFSEYLKLFSGANNETAIGEASPSYLYNQLAPSLIKQHFPDIRLIVILRHPTDRAYSNFLHARRSGREPEKTFSKSIDMEEGRIKDQWSPLYHYIKKGYYSEQLERYYQFFDKENIRVYLFEDIVNNTQETLKDIFSYLEVNENIEIDTSKKANVSGIPSGPIGWVIKKMRFYNIMPKFTLSEYLPKFIITFLSKIIYKKTEKLDYNLRKKITQQYYKNEIRYLEKIINRDLSSWLS